MAIYYGSSTTIKTKWQLENPNPKLIGMEKMTYWNGNLPRKEAVKQNNEFLKELRETIEKNPEEITRVHRRILEDILFSKRYTGYTTMDMQVLDAKVYKLASKTPQEF